MAEDAMRRVNSRRTAAQPELSEDSKALPDLEIEWPGARGKRRRRAAAHDSREIISTKWMPAKAN